MKRFFGLTEELRNEGAGSGGYQDQIDLLRNRVKLLTGKDKLLVTMYIDNGNSFRQMAQLVGVNEGTIARRIHKLVKRLIDNEYALCLQNRDRFNAGQMSIAKDHFLTGLSLRKIAIRRRVSCYKIRQSIREMRWEIQKAEDRKQKGEER